MGKTYSVHVRQIDNGFIARHSESGNGEYHEREVFMPKAPEGLFSKKAPAPPMDPVKLAANAGKRK